MNLSIIVPCFNEEQNIRHNVGLIVQHLAQGKPDLSYEIVLINDGSTDTTGQILDSMKSSSIKVHHFAHNKGRGAAIIHGIQHSQGDIVITYDADLSYDLNHIDEILTCFHQDVTLDAVIVSAYAKGGVVKNVPFQRLLISRLANWLLSSFFNKKISTVTCVVRGYKGELIRKIKLFETNKELHLEILRKLMLYNAHLKEIPGRLIWKKESKANKRRSNNLKVLDSGLKHLLYALMVKPTGFFSLLTFIFLAIGLYESLVFLWCVFNNLDLTTYTFSKGIWRALSVSYSQSPHTFFIALGATIIGLNTLCFLMSMSISKKHHEESLRHLLALLEKTKES